jgi:subtilisin family serine protease
MKTVLTVGFLALIVLALTFPFTQATAQKERRGYRAPVIREEPFVPGRVLVKFRSNIGLDHARQIVASLGARDADTLPGTGVMVLDLPEQADEAAFAQALTLRPDVEFAELDRILKPAEMTPNDPWYANWEGHLKRIQAPAAWSITTGASNVVIAILDTGVDGTHEDLASKLVPGWNIYNNNSNTSDVGGHGTAVAGTAAAVSNNGVGVASVCWGCMIMPIRVSDGSTGATYSAIASGLNWAADHGARVANISYIVSESATVTSSAKYFQGKGGIVPSSAGNYSTFSSASDNPYILTVSATDYNDALSGYSNTGNNVDLAAPGNSFSTIKGGTYDSVSGTSFSAPIVAGVAALVLSVNPNLSPNQVQDILKQSADDFGSPGWDPSYGWGRVNAGRAVLLASGNTTPSDTTAPAVSFSSPANGAIVSGTVPILVSASDNVAVASVTVSVDAVPVVTDSVAPFSFNWTTTMWPNGGHTITASASDAAGNSSEAVLSVIVNNVVDTTLPTVAITSPTDGTKVSTNVSIKVNATDDIKVSKVELYVDGFLQGASTTAPFTTKWNSGKAAKGQHTLQCKAYDAAGNVGSSQTVTVNK